MKSLVRGSKKVPAAKAGKPTKNGSAQNGNAAARATARLEVKDIKGETKKQKRERLNTEREIAVLELGRLREQMKTEIEHDTEDGDPEVYEREKLMAVIRTLEEKIGSIDYALKALDQGQYGICERCGNEIGAERLKAIPDTTLCVKCKAETEKMIKRGFTPA